MEEFCYRNRADSEKIENVKQETFTKDLIENFSNKEEPLMLRD